MNAYVRAVISASVAAAGKLLRIDAAGRVGETFTNREVLQQYGLQSRPPAGAEAIVIRRGGQIVVIASDNREYRIALDEGEVAIVSDEGDKIHIKRDRKMEITVGTALQPGQLTIDVAGPLQGSVVINAGGSVDISAPTVRLGGLALETALGIVTGACACAITGAPHAVTSQTVKATL